MAPSLSPPFPHPVILVPRADTSEPATDKESTFSGQAFAVGLIVGILICATIAGAVLLLRRRKQERVHLVPDVYNYVQPGTTQGHHIISEPTLGDDHDEVSSIGHSPSSMGHSARSRRNTRQASMIMQIGTVQWAYSANDVTHSPTKETHPNTHLPTAFRDANGKFQAPESPTDWSGSPLQSPDPAFSHSALMRPISTASGESSTSTQRSLFRKGEKSSTRAADDRSTVRSRDSKLKIELGRAGERWDRSRSARQRDPPSSPTSAVVDTDTVGELPEPPNPGANVPPPYSMEEDPDPFGRRDPGPLPRKKR